MICIVPIEQEPDKPEPAEPDKPLPELKTLQLVFRASDDNWNLGLVLVQEELDSVMADEAKAIRLMQQLPIFGAVPPAVMVFLSSLAAQDTSQDRLVLQVQMALEGDEDFAVLIPVPLTLESAVILRTEHMLALAAPTTIKAPIWEGLQNILLFYAQTHVELERLVRSLPGHSNAKVF